MAIQKVTSFANGYQIYSEARVVTMGSGRSYIIGFIFILGFVGTLALTSKFVQFPFFSSSRISPEATMTSVRK